MKSTLCSVYMECHCGAAWGQVPGSQGVHGQKSSALVYVVGTELSVYEREYTGKKQDGQQSPVVKEGSHSILVRTKILWRSVPFFRDSRLGFFEMGLCSLSWPQTCDGLPGWPSQMLRFDMATECLPALPLNFI